MAAVTIMTMYEASQRNLLDKHVDQLHWVDVYVSVSAILLIFVGAWVWVFTVRKKEYYADLMTNPNVSRQGLDLEVRRSIPASALRIALGTSHSGPQT